MRIITVHLGSTGPLVQKWQETIGVKQDGLFGPVTLAKTRLWQAVHNLDPDGIVGLQTWTAAIGQKGIDLMGKWYDTTFGAAEADTTARAVVDRALPNLSEAQKQYLLSVARGEGYYGRGWKVETAGQAGATSKNWGAVQGTGSAGSFQTHDTHADGTVYTGTFKRYNTDDEAARDMANILFAKKGAMNGRIKEDVGDILNKTGSLRKAVFAQHGNGYFELDPSKYLSTVKTNYDKLSSALGWKRLLSEAGGATVGVGLIAFASGVGYFIAKRFLRS